MLSLFADQEREAKLDSLGDPLALLDKHVDFAALAAENRSLGSQAQPGQGRSATVSDRADDSPAGAPAAVQPVR